MKIKITAFLCMAIVGFATARPAWSAPAQTSAQGQGQSQAPSLYKRLGGYDALAAVTDDLFDLLYVRHRQRHGDGDQYDHQGGHDDCLGRHPWRLYRGRRPG